MEDETGTQAARRHRPAILDKAAQVAGKLSEEAALRVAAGLKPVRELGRAVEGSRIAVETSVQDTAAAAAARVRRSLVAAGLHGANLAGATAETALHLLLDPFNLLQTRAKYLEVRREIAETLARYDRALEDATRAERERIALAAVERLTRWDHARTLHHRSAYLHVSVGPGMREAWGMVLRGPQAGRSLASVTPEALAEIWAHVPDADTAAALEAWAVAVCGATPGVAKDPAPGP